MALLTSERRKKRTRKRHEMPLAVRARALALAQEVRESIETLIKEGVAVVDIAAALGCSRREVWEWRRGPIAPREPFLCFCLLEWGRFLRDCRSYQAQMMKALADAGARKEKDNASTDTGHTGI